LFAIADCANQGRGGNRANAGYLLQAFGIGVAAGQRFYGLIQLIDTFIERN
jgi:hypothetical protein